MVGYSELDKKRRKEYSSKVNFPGLAQLKAVVKCLWDQQFAAVAWENLAFECIRKQDDVSSDTRQVMLSIVLTLIFIHGFRGP